MAQQPTASSPLQQLESTGLGLFQQLEAMAETAWEKVENEAIEIEQKLVPVIEDGFAMLLNDFGTLAVNTVINLMTGAFAHLSGSEKQNLTATTITDAAESAGKAVLAADVTTLAKNAFIAVVGKAPQV